VTCNKPFTAGRHTQEFTIDGVTRSTLFYVPQGYDGTSPIPLVFNLHGTSGTPEGQNDATGIEAFADERGFVVASMAGYLNRWNVARDPAQPDDVELAEASIDWAAENLCLDQARVYSTGFSGGARMSSRLACAIPDRIAAIGPVAGLRNDPPCDVSGVPVLTLHGTGDGTNFYDGCPEADTTCSRNGEWVENVENAVADWVQANGCNASPTLDEVSAGVERQTYADCTSGAPVIFYKVTDGAHVWELLPNTTEVVLDFFAEH
jgi:polyhydroxybutyrate depolymerase